MITEAIHDLQGAPADHAKEALEHLLKTGINPAGGARDFVQDVREGKFMATNYKNFSRVREEWAGSQCRLLGGILIYWLASIQSRELI